LARECPFERPCCIQPEHCQISRYGQAGELSDEQSGKAVGEGNGTPMVALTARHVLG